MVGMKHKYDDEQLVELLVEKQHTHTQIAQMLGVSESLIKKISCGRKRPELQRRIWDAENGLMSDARRLGARYARGLVSRQIELGLTGEGEAARRAREFVLKWALAARPRRSQLPIDWQEEMDKEAALMGLGDPDPSALLRTGEPAVNQE